MPTLVDAAELARHLDDPSWAIVDCRFDLADPAAGPRRYEEGHIPGAVYADLEKDLSAPPTGANGRHPLPSVERLAEVFSRLGIGPGVTVVAYDDGPGPIAARLWWTLRYLGHDDVAVLDGGFEAWRRAGLPVRSGTETRPPRPFVPRPRPEMAVDAAAVAARLGDPGLVLLDAREPKRYRGEEEPLDPVAGHIPGAVNHFWQENLGEDDRFLPAETLRRRFAARLGDRPADAVVSYCGSGVTACHNLLALEHAGLRGARLYPGSGSEWCADPSRPVATGEEPAGRGR